MNDVLARNELYTPGDEKIYASYIKKILGQVGVNVWDKFTNTPTYTVLRGDPRKGGDDCIIDVWSAREDAYLKRSNKKHFEKGILVPYQRPENVVVETPIEQYSDDQLREIVNSKFVTLNKRLNEIESEVVIYRMLSLASEMEKSDKIVKALEARLSEIQSAAYLAKPELAPEEE